MKHPGLILGVFQRYTPFDPAPTPTLPHTVPVSFREGMPL
jgi:hypothetical protein